MSDEKTSFIDSLVDNEKKLAEAIVAGKTADEVAAELGFDEAQFNKMAGRLAKYDEAGDADAAVDDAGTATDAPVTEGETGAAPVEGADAPGTGEAAPEGGDSGEATATEEAPVEQTDAPTEGDAPAADEAEAAKPEGDAAAA